MARGKCNSGWFRPGEGPGTKGGEALLEAVQIASDRLSWNIDCELVVPAQPSRLVGTSLGPPFLPVADGPLVFKDLTRPQEPDCRSHPRGAVNAGYIGRGKYHLKKET